MSAVDRRNFLRTAGGFGAFALLTACGDGGPATTTTAATTPTTAPPSTATAVPPDWDGLKSRLKGTLAQPGQPGYDAARPFNTALAKTSPSAVAQVRGVEDVQTCIEMARRSHIPIAARSGGHSYAGYSCPDRALVVDLRTVNSVEVRGDGTAEVGAGARLSDVYEALAAKGRCLPAGTCPTVGIAGLALGGGLGVLTRKFGLTADHMVSARIVTADGVNHTASADGDSDLHWALRGGGGGNFGIVTSFEFSTEAAPGQLTVFHLEFAAGSSAEVLGAWQDWIGEAPTELWANCVIEGGSPPRPRVSGCYVGASARANTMLTQLARRTGARVTNRNVQTMNYLSAMRHFAGSSGKTGFVASSRVLEKRMDEPGSLAALVNDRPDMDLLFDPLGGAVSTVDATATAFPHRGALATVQVYADTEAGQFRSVASQVDNAQRDIAEQVGRGAYVNYIDPAQRDWPQAYYGNNLSRLRQVANTYDPDGVFAFAQGLRTR
ncbi:FAD-dependent oxidoreductase [Allokutzneria sp. A3M-2-11 16]|uniref:FAD-binding oxidoreductase n=1 Tax=Allokutzneria sp. A3M-2-11 16 TaxID=2962043 RepID=UPI0020B6C72C|nr:FAD-binding oxidoreductase [Allokutzneria sp. A3M-2-11 16]MCP3798812.1 FAD-dependent oxidoreductase [Allokutzneria sp. A3M-2-11 16]